MLTKSKIPFINENRSTKDALKVIQKKLGFVIIINNDGITKGIFTDGDLKRSLQRKNQLKI